MEQKTIKDIKKLLEDALKQSKNQDNLFLGPIKQEDFIAQIIFEFIKIKYYDGLPRTSLRSSLPDPSEDAYAQIKRNRAAAAAEQDKLCKRLGISPQTISSYQSKADGYHYNTLQIHQIANYKNLEIIKALSTGRMASSKKIDRNRFREIFQEYQLYVLTQIEQAKLSSQECLNCAIDFYDLQNRMKLELTYTIACLMVERGLRDYPQQLSFAVSGCYGEGYSLQNRFVLRQNDLLPNLLSDDPMMVDSSKQRLFLLLLHKKEIMDTFREQFLEISFEMDDMANFVRKEYNPFSIFQSPKEWTDPQVDAARKILNALWVE